MRVVRPFEMEGVTLMIRGPLAEDSRKFYRAFYEHVPKVFSVWEGHDQEAEGPQSFVVENERPERFSFYDRDMELDVFATLRGLECVKTEYVIRLKGDEWYSNLNVVAEAMKKEPEKVHIVPVFLKKWDAWPFHLSDHVIAGKTEVVKSMFQRCIINMESGRQMDSGCWPLPFQSILAKGYLDFRKGLAASKEDFKEFFSILPLDELRFYKISRNNQNWYSNFKPSVSSMDEI